MDAVIAQNLSSRVESAIKKILGDDVTEFDGPEFSAVDYVNKHFPDESSLSGLDVAIGDLDAEIASLDGSILETVREQSSAGGSAARDVAEAKDSIGDLHGKIKEIKRKADASEAMVQEICRDIRRLDVAKKNLTNTINVLARLKTLSSAVDELRAHAARRNYEEAAPVFEASISLFAHFTEYRDVPKVSELATAVEKTRDELRCVAPQGVVQGAAAEEDDSPQRRMIRLAAGQAGGLAGGVVGWRCAGGCSLALP